MATKLYFGVYPGTVVTKADTTKKDRVRLHVPQVLGKALSGWADPLTPITAVPAVGEVVWVLFTGGDPRYPVYSTVEAQPAPPASNVPSPATTVSDQTSFGVAKAVGNHTAYAREDHSHGTPLAPTAASVGAVAKSGDTMTGALLLSGDPTAALGAATKQYVDNHSSVGPSPATSVSDETAFGVAKSVGTMSTYAREDHTHGTPPAPTAASIGAVPLAGGTMTGLLSANAGLSTSSFRLGTSATAGQVLTADASGNGTYQAVPLPNTPQPSDQGFISWTSDPVSLTNDFTPTMGTVYLARIPIRQATTISKVFLIVGGAASASMGAYMGLYDSSGTLRGSTSSTLALTSSGLATGTLSTSYSAPAGFYWVAFLTTVTPTTPALIANHGNTGSTFNNFANSNLSVVTYRWATNGTGKTSLPASITPSSNSQGNMDWWAAAA